MRRNDNSWLVQSKRREERQLAEQGKRVVTEATPKGKVVVAADLSGSMESPAFEGKTRYECLQEACKPFKGRMLVLAFDSRVFEVDADQLPPPGLSTDMALALRTANGLDPRKVLLISDGMPDSVSHAYEEAKRLSEKCIIDCLYIGPENDKIAIDTMKEIARIGRGRYRSFQIDKMSPALLEAKIDQLLALPNPGSIQL